TRPEDVQFGRSDFLDDVYVREPDVVLDCISNFGDTFARISNPTGILDRIGDLGNVLGSVRDSGTILDGSDPSASFFSGLYPSLWLTGRLKR
ncbi:MAG: hypothetical protein GY835_10340, partial [bacterium]|nr:hypothetical protein [bacterium]